MKCFEAESNGSNCDIPIKKARIDYIEINERRIYLDICFSSVIDELDSEKMLVFQRHFRRDFPRSNRPYAVMKSMFFGISISIFTKSKAQRYHVAFADTHAHEVQSISLGLIFNKDYRISIPLHGI